MVRELGAGFLNGSEKVIGGDIVDVIDCFVAPVFEDSLLSDFGTVPRYANFQHCLFDMLEMKWKFLRRDNSLPCVVLTDILVHPL